MDAPALNEILDRPPAGDVSCGGRVPSAPPCRFTEAFRYCSRMPAFPPPAALYSPPPRHLRRRGARLAGISFRFSLLRGALFLAFVACLAVILVQRGNPGWRWWAGAGFWLVAFFWVLPYHDRVIQRQRREGELRTDQRGGAAADRPRLDRACPSRPFRSRTTRNGRSPATSTSSAAPRWPSCSARSTPLPARPPSRTGCSIPRRPRRSSGGRRRSRSWLPRSTCASSSRCAPGPWTRRRAGHRALPRAGPRGSRGCSGVPG